MSEELLKGTFEGMNKIDVEAVRDEDGKMKHLKFEGEFIEPPAEPEPEEPVGVGAGDTPAEEEESEPENNDE